MNTGSKVVAPKFGILSTIAWTIENTTTYALEGSVMVGGSAVKWLRDGLLAFDSSSKAEKLALKSDSNYDLFVIPTFYGLGTPFWDNKVKGSILGLQAHTKLSDITYSTLQSIAFQCEDVMQSMQKASKIDIKSLKVDGGATKNKLLMQMQADVSNTPISVSADSESTVRGAAMLAALALGLQINSTRIAETFTPQNNKLSIQNKYLRWKKLIQQIRKIYN
jgi:glycerol kinase